jgi:hypothetical protein
MVTAARVQQLWERLQAGENFWTVIHEPFKQKELTRAEVVAVIDRGLRQTAGRYRALLPLFNLEPSDYKRLHAFLYQQRCNLPVGPYRMQRAGAASADTAPVGGARIDSPERDLRARGSW